MLQQFSLANLMHQQPQPMQTSGPTGSFTQMPQQFSAPQVTLDTLNAFTDPNSQLMQNAAYRGREYAQERGGLNSTIGAGASQRAQMEAAMPLVQQSMGLQGQREQQANQLVMQQRQGEIDNWLGEQGFSRDFAGALAMMPITNAYDMMNMVQQYALQDPTLYTPDVISGYTNFFSMNMQDIIGQLLGGGGQP